MTALFEQIQPTTAFLMTDMVGSSRLWETDPAGMGGRVARLDDLMHAQITANNGEIIRPRGEGDSHFAVFPTATEAILGAISANQSIVEDASLAGIKLRMAIHTGPTEMIGGYPYGTVLNRCSRIREAASPDQILVSNAVCMLATPEGRFGLKYLGQHRLRDLMEPERLYQVLHPNLPSEFGPLDTLSNLSHNLPSDLTSFIGRNEDLRELQASIKKTRILTICGPGGVGKTRLAQQVAAERIADYKQGVWFVDLAQTERAQTVLPIICETIEPGMEPSESALLHALAHREILLILDNCEHVVEVCRQLVRRLVSACPRLTVLATSRRTLEVAGELVHRLDGLRLPEPHQMSEAGEFEGVRLFIERAEQKATGLKTNEETTADIVTLCSMVDGLPLAIEILAGLTGVLSVRQIADSLQDCLDISDGEKSEDPRQHTIAASIQSSKRLLTKEAQLLLSRLVFFPNTWTLEGAHQVCMPGESVLTVIRLLRELVAHSLVVSTRTHTDQLKFSLLQVTRQVLSREAADVSDMVLPFIDRCRAAVAEAEKLRNEGEEATAHESIAREWESVMKALELSETAAPAVCAEMALSLRSFWAGGTRLLEGKCWYERLARSSGIGAAQRVSIEIALSGLYILLGENERALRLLIGAVEIASPIGGAELARALSALAVHHERMGQLEDSERLLVRTCELFRESGALRDEARDAMNLGVILRRMNRPPEVSRDLFMRGLKCGEEAGSISLQARANSCLGHLSFEQGDLRGAFARHRLAQSLWQESLNIHECAPSVLELSEIFILLGRFEAAAKAIVLAERLEELSHSPFTSLHRRQLDAARDAAKPHVTHAEWRSFQRLTRAKAAPELVTMIIQVMDGVALDL